MKEIKKLDQKGLDFIIKEEEIVLKPYYYQVGIPSSKNVYISAKNYTLQQRLLVPRLDN